MSYIYRLDYDDPTHSEEDTVNIAIMKLAITMHALADRYDVRVLEEISTLKLRKAMFGVFTTDGATWVAADALKIIREVYEITNQGDNAIRAVVNTLACRHLAELVPLEGFKDLLADHPDLAYKVIHRCTETISKHDQIISAYRTPTFR